MKTLQDVKNELLKKPGFRKEYNKKDQNFEVAQMVMEARISYRLTQTQLARLVKTKQPSIARLEGGAHTPSLVLLQKIADALKIHMSWPRFETIESVVGTSYNTQVSLLKKEEFSSHLPQVRIANKG